MAMLSRPCSSAPWGGSLLCIWCPTWRLLPAQGPPGHLAVEASAAWFLRPMGHTHRLGSQQFLAEPHRHTAQTGPGTVLVAPLREHPTCLLGTLTWDSWGAIWRPRSVHLHTLPLPPAGALASTSCTRTSALAAETSSVISSGATGVCSWAQGISIGKDRSSLPPTPL